MEAILPLIIFGTIFGGVGIVLGIDNLNDKRINFNRKLSDMNQLYKCDSCHRYFRKYLVDLKRDYDPAYTAKRTNFEQSTGNFISYYTQFCPHCESGTSAECKKAEKWVDTHPDAPLLTRGNIRTFNKMKEELSMLIYENTVNLTDKDRDIDFLCSEMLFKISGPGKKEERWN